MPKTVFARREVDSSKIEKERKKEFDFTLVSSFFL